MARPSQIITVDRDRFRLEVWRDRPDGTYRRARLCEISVGAEGMATPRGVYAVDGKTRKPDWLSPSGEKIPWGDERNPFEGGFISLSGGRGVGLHGTSFDPKLGTRASHGCVRMATRDFLWLYDRVRTGETVVVIL